MRSTIVMRYNIGRIQDKLTDTPATGTHEREKTKRKKNKSKLKRNKAMKKEEMR